MADPTSGTLLRLAAFTRDPTAGNPAGVWIGSVLPPNDEMQRVAAEVGYSETAFLAPDGSGLAGRYRVRFFSPLAEVPFCGHATIAGGVALGERDMAGPPDDDGGPGRIVLQTNDGPVAVMVSVRDDGTTEATLTSIEPWVREPDPDLPAATLALLGWQTDELDPRLPPAIAFAGVKHLILAVRDLDRLARLDYPFEALRRLMLDADLTTLQLVWREGPDRFRARDPFPVGGVVEDPATGAAAAALGAYLRARGELVPPASFEVVQGVEMGRPGRITVSVVPGEPGIRVTGTAVTILT